MHHMGINNVVQVSIATSFIIHTCPMERNWAQKDTMEVLEMMPDFKNVMAYLI